MIRELTRDELEAEYYWAWELIRALNNDVLRFNAALTAALGQRGDEVVLRLEWRGTQLFAGKLNVGYISPSVNVGWWAHYKGFGGIYGSTHHPTEAEARAALVVTAQE